MKCVLSQLGPSVRPSVHPLRENFENVFFSSFFALRVLTSHFCRLLPTCLIFALFFLFLLLLLLLLSLLPSIISHPSSPFSPFPQVRTNRGQTRLEWEGGATHTKSKTEGGGELSVLKGAENKGVPHVRSTTIGTMNSRQRCTPRRRFFSGWPAPQIGLRQKRISCRKERASQKHFFLRLFHFMKTKRLCRFFSFS